MGLGREGSPSLMGRGYGCTERRRSGAERYREAVAKGQKKRDVETQKDRGAEQRDRGFERYRQAETDTQRKVGR